MIAITDLIRSQIFESLVMLSAGILFMLLYDIVGWLQEKIFTQNFFKALLEVMFWIEGAFLTSAFLYYCAYGQISVHTFSAFLIGVLLWKIFFCGTMKGNG